MITTGRAGAAERRPRGAAGRRPGGAAAGAGGSGGGGAAPAAPDAASARRRTSRGRRARRGDADPTDSSSNADFQCPSRASPFNAPSRCSCCRPSSCCSARISLFRLPVDLMPDVTYPTITVRVGYGGVGPAEIEQLIVRPLEQTLAAVPGLDQINSTASEGSGNVRLNFAWGTNLNEAADEIRTRMDRVRGRLPVESDPPNISKFDASASPIMGIGVEGDFDRVTLREMAETDIAPRLERVEGVAAVTVQRRPAPADSHRAVQGEDHGARPGRRSRHQHDPVGEPERPARRTDGGRHELPAAQPGRIPEPRSDPRPRRPDQGRRAGLPARHRRDQGHDRRPAVVHAHQRQARRPPAGLEAVRQEHRGDCRRRARGNRAHQPRHAQRAA